MTRPSRGSRSPGGHCALAENHVPRALLGQAEGGRSLTLDEIADQIAERLGVERKEAADGKVRLEGRQANLWVMPFFGGWQIDVELPGKPRYQFFEEDVRMLVQRIEGRLRAYVREQEEEAVRQQQQKRRPGR